MTLIRLFGFVFLILSVSHSEAQQTMLQVLEPGIGYARFKQWTVDNHFVFENFTKDSLVVRDTGLRQWETTRIQARFCGGDDYSGKASNITIQQLFILTADGAPTMAANALTMQRDYVEFLAGKANDDGKFPDAFSGRRDRKDGNDGLAFSQQTEKGYWEVGLFVKKEASNVSVLTLQTIRRRDRSVSEDGTARAAAFRDYCHIADSVSKERPSAKAGSNLLVLPSQNRPLT